LVILQKNVPGLSSHTLDQFVSRAKKSLRLSGTVNVLVTGSAAIRVLNREFCGKDKSTDVLSFPTAGSGLDSSRTKLAGEIAICADIAVQNAYRFGHSPAQEVKILALHGLLHLAGFDHERDNGEMARREQNLRRELRLPVALIERVGSFHRHRGERPKKGRGAA